MRKFKVGDKVKFKREYYNGIAEGSGVIAYLNPDGEMIIKGYEGDGGQNASQSYPEYNIKAGDRCRIVAPGYCTLIRNSRITKKYT